MFPIFPSRAPVKVCGLGSIYTPIMELGPPNHNIWTLGVGGLENQTRVDGLGLRRVRDSNGCQGFCISMGFCKV